MTRDEAISATQNGASAAFFSAAFTTLFVAWAVWVNDEDGSLSVFNDLSNVADVLFVVCLGIGMRRRSRAAAVAMVIYWIVSKTAIGLETGKVAGLGMALVFLYFFVQAARGAFVYHRIERDDNPDYTKPSILWAAIGIPVGTIALGLVVGGVYLEAGAPEMLTVVEGGELSPETITALRKENIIGEAEQIEFIYVDGLTSVLDRGVILTQDRVIRYFEGDDPGGGINIYALRFKDVGAVTLMEPGDFFTDSLYQISSPDGESWFQILLPAEDQADVRFIEELNKRVGR